MANVNTITTLVNLPSQTINATAETVLVNAAGVAAVLSMPPQANVDSHSFQVRLIGKTTGGTAATLTLAFRLGSITGTKFATFTVSGAAIPVAGSNFSVQADLTWDSVSQTVNGTIAGQTANTLVVGAAITQLTAVTSASALQFVATATFGAALATNSVTVEEFTINQI